jgi:murein DD-endopeptidase MepM/ murein hydrolase activator NlpD
MVIGGSMGLNPFKDSSLNELQNGVSDYLSDRYDSVRGRFSTWWGRVRKKGNERLTIMIIPHSEKKIVNLHISIFAISAVSSVLIIIITITSMLIFKHASSVKEVSRLKLYGSDSKVQIQFYKEEINKLYDVFQRFKPEITYLYSLESQNNIDSLWSKGGGTSPGIQVSEADAPSIETLNLEEMERELKTSKRVIDDIKSYMEQRKKIIENTPSLWPVNGYIISSFGKRSLSANGREDSGKGIGIAAYPGSEIHATAPGTVKSIKWENSQGLTVTLEHKYGFFTVYSHCQRVTVEEGQKVSKNETIAYVGRTGRADEYMCEYQIIIGADFVDPMPYLNKIVRASE